MKDVKIVPYQKKFDYSYSFGIYPTIELLKFQPKKVIKVILHSRAKNSNGVRQIIDLCKKNQVRTEIADGLIQKISGSENTYAIGVFDKYSTKIEENKNHLVLVNPEDTGNLGTVIRSALGFGIKNLVIIRPAVDCFDPKTIRASMGAVFSVNIEYFEYFEDYKEAHTNKCYMFMTNGERELSQVKFESPYSLVFGSESAGLENRFKTYGQGVVIKQSKDVDSLNLSIAVGIALYKSFAN